MGQERTAARLGHPARRRRSTVVWCSGEAHERAVKAHEHGIMNADAARRCPGSPAAPSRVLKLDRRDLATLTAQASFGECP